MVGIGMLRKSKEKLFDPERAQKKADKKELKEAKKLDKSMKKATKYDRKIEKAEKKIEKADETKMKSVKKIAKLKGETTNVAEDDYDLNTVESGGSGSGPVEDSNYDEKLALQKAQSKDDLKKSIVEGSVKVGASAIGIGGALYLAKSFGKNTLTKVTDTWEGFKKDVSDLYGNTVDPALDKLDNFRTKNRKFLDGEIDTLKENIDGMGGGKKMREDMNDHIKDYYKDIFSDPSGTASKFWGDCKYSFGAFVDKGKDIAKTYKNTYTDEDLKIIEANKKLIEFDDKTNGKSLDKFKIFNRDDKNDLPYGIVLVDHSDDPAASVPNGKPYVASDDSVKKPYDRTKEEIAQILIEADDKKNGKLKDKFKSYNEQTCEIEIHDEDPNPSSEADAEVDVEPEPELG